ncbi:MAG TPA: hypothetical protein VFZ34_21945 [Blastocatellia bacterium]|nr:hypothetical protein [Blastocatellia bacterium]
MARLKDAATYVFQGNDAELEKVRSRFAPYQRTTIATASGAEILSAVMRNYFKDVLGFEEMMATVSLKILGEIEETPDTVHLLVRTVLEIGRPEVISCQKRNGQWRLLLKQDALQLVAMIEQQRHLRAQNLPLEPVVKRMSMPKPTVLGYVEDGDAQVQVLCRVTTIIDKVSLSTLLCYPVRPTDNAWRFLGDKAKFAEAFRAAWPF